MGAISLLLSACSADPTPLASDSPASVDTLAPLLLGPGAAVTGRWTTLPFLMDHNPVHAALLHSKVTMTERRRLGGHVGKLFVMSGSGDDSTEVNFNSEIVDLSRGTMTSQNMPIDAFCAGVSILPNGDPFIVGGTMYDPVDPAAQEKGLANVQTYHVKSDSFVAQPNMAHGRWYATATLLDDGREMVDTGWDQNAMNDTVEIFTPGAGGGWTAEFPMGWTSYFYLRQHLLPDGTVFDASPETDTKIFDPAVASPGNPGWRHVAWTNYGANPNEWNREYGTSVLLPLTPDNGYDPKVLIMGGNRFYPTDTTETIDLDAAVPAWSWGPTMSQQRVRMQGVLLADGTVLAIGGSSVDLDPANASLNADLYDPATNTFSDAGVTAYAHLDHSVALLLPDATVWFAGSQGVPGSYEQHMEIYEPAYLFQANGAYAHRPVLADGPASAGYNVNFAVRTDGSAIDSIMLVRPGAVTHSFNTDQRVVGLDFTQDAAGTLTITTPPGPTIAPPGFYMMFAIDTAGVPSVATFIQLH
jgi:hypothetical protein